MWVNIKDALPPIGEWILVEVACWTEDDLFWNGFAAVVRDPNAKFGYGFKCLPHFDDYEQIDVTRWMLIEKTRES